MKECKLHSSPSFTEAQSATVVKAETRTSSLWLAGFGGTLAAKGGCHADSGLLYPGNLGTPMAPPPQGQLGACITLTNHLMTNKSK